MSTYSVTGVPTEYRYECVCVCVCVSLIYIFLRIVITFFNLSFLIYSHLFSYTTLLHYLPIEFTGYHGVNEYLSRSHVS